MLIGKGNVSFVLDTTECSKKGKGNRSKFVVVDVVLVVVVVVAVVVVVVILTGNGEIDWSIESRGEQKRREKKRKEKKRKEESTEVKCHYHLDRYY